MKPSLYGTAAGLLGLLLLGASGALPAGQAGGNPHDFMKDPERCADCHAEVPDPKVDDYTTVTFQDQIVTLCVTCHPQAHYREEHPVEINPDSEVPEEYHLDSYYTITCATCHDPHGEHESVKRHVPPGFFQLVVSLLQGQERFPTYFLRSTNVNGELCLGCHRHGLGGVGGEEFSTELLPKYVGSEVCGECHESVYREWKRTLHAYNFRDSLKDGKAVRATFEGEEPFPPGDVRFTVGEHWTQRYIIESAKGLMVRPEQWSILGRQWLKSGGSFSRPWLRYCAGCHTTALNPFDGAYVERGTGCESCHGPGLQHTETTDQFDIVNPALLVQSRRDMICEACHTSGHDRSGRFRYPLGFTPGEDLTRYYRGLVPKAGQDAESFTGDGSYEDRHRQFHFWASRVNIMQGLSCDICTGLERPKPTEEGKEQEEYALSPNDMCGTCHGDVFDDFESHSGHSRGQAKCLDCHPPALTADGGSFSIHDHKFHFEAPPEWVVQGVDRCVRCHPSMDAGSGAAAL